MEVTRVRVMLLRLNPVQSGDAVSSVVTFFVATKYDAEGIHKHFFLHCKYPSVLLSTCVRYKGMRRKGGPTYKGDCKVAIIIPFYPIDPGVRYFNLFVMEIFLFFCFFFFCSWLRQNAVLVLVKPYLNC